MVAWVLCSFRVQKLISLLLRSPPLSTTCGHFHLGAHPPAISGSCLLSCSLWVPFHGLLCDACGSFPQSMVHPLSPPECSPPQIHTFLTSCLAPMLYPPLNKVFMPQLRVIIYVFNPKIHFCPFFFFLPHSLSAAIKYNLIMFSALHSN